MHLRIYIHTLRIKCTHIIDINLLNTLHMHSQPLVPTLLLNCSTHSQSTHHCLLWDLLCNNAQVNTHNYPHSRSCLQSSQWMLFWPCSHIHCPASSIRGQLEWSGPFLEAPNGLDIGFWTISSRSIGTWERVATECSNCPAFRVGHGRISMHTHWTANMAVILWNPHNLTISAWEGTLVAALTTSCTSRVLHN